MTLGFKLCLLILDSAGIFWVELPSVLRVLQNGILSKSLSQLA